MRTPGRSVVAVLLAAGAALAAGAPAYASDASVRKAVVAQEARVAQAMEAFDDDTTDVVSAVGRERSLGAVQDLAAAVRRQRTAVTRQRATTERIRRARTQYLTAVSGSLAGLATFEAGLDAFDPDSPSKAATLVRRARAQLEAAATRRLRAARVLRITR